MTKQIIKKQVTLLIASIAIILALHSGGRLQSQCQPSIKVDGNKSIVGQSDATSWVSFPLWLKEGQTIEPYYMVSSISVIEFNVNSNTLEFSAVIPVTSLQAVPAGKVWKVESVIRLRSVEMEDEVLYTTPGTHLFTVPLCVDFICVEVWGGGGCGAGGGNYHGGGGGGGAYGRECFAVSPGSQHTVIVGIGGNNSHGGTSSFGSFISASGGLGSLNSSTIGGAGGTSSAAFNISGAAGTNGANYLGGSGGNAGNGGQGGQGGAPGMRGSAPGGGGGGGSYQGNVVYPGGGGGAGLVKIAW